MPHQYCNTIPSSISVSFPPSRSHVPPPVPLFHTGTIARTMPGCHHIKHRPREGARDRWRRRQRITVRVEMWLCIKAKLRGKNFLLNWLYIHEKKNHNVCLSLSLSRCVALSLSLSVSWCQLSTRYQCLLLHIAIKAIFCVGSNPTFHLRLLTLYFFFLFSCTFFFFFDTLATNRGALTVLRSCISSWRGD